MNRDKLISDLTGDEGIKLCAYDDASGSYIRPGSRLGGHPTIGIGRALDTQGITAAEAQWLLDNDIDRVAAELAPCTWYAGQSDVRQNVLLNMCFNLGLAGLLQFHDLIEYLGDGRYELAAKAMEASIWYRQVGARAARLANEMRSGQYAT